MFIKIENNQTERNKRNMFLYYNLKTEKTHTKIEIISMVFAEGRKALKGT